MPSWYLKELVGNAFIVDGKAVQFEVFPGNTGLIELDTEKDKAIVTALDEAAREGRAGIVKLTEAQFAEKKSQLASAPLPRRPRKDMLRVAPRGPFDRKPKSDTEAAAAPAEAPKPPPVGTPPQRLTRSAQAATTGKDALPAPIQEGFRPPTRRIKRAATEGEPPPVKSVQ